MPPTLYIVDGLAQIFSAYYAPMGSQFTSPTGEPTKATYIFATIMQKLVKKCQNDWLVVALDSPGKTFRHVLYSEYKANRPEPPDDLPVQIRRCKDLLHAMNITTYSLEGYEADDLIGSLCHFAVKKDIPVRICSKDKDFEQLITENIVMYDIKKDLVYDTTSLFEKKGITPAQVIDTLALIGDASDNVPGCPDVGPKTAQQWIEKYQTLDVLLENQVDIKGKRGDSLRANIDQILLSKQLVTIDLKAPIEINEVDFCLKEPNIDDLASLYKTLGFTKFLSDLRQASFQLVGDDHPIAASPALAVERPQTTLVDTEEKLMAFIDLLAKQNIFAFDTETTALNPVAASLVGISFSWEAKKAYYLPVAAPLGQQKLDIDQTITLLTPIMRDRNIKKIGHNIKYDMIIMKGAGIDVAGIYFDTMIASSLVDSARLRHNLNALALELLGYETISIEKLIGKGKKQITFDMVDTDIAGEYGGEDAEVTWRLYEVLSKRIQSGALFVLFHEIEMPLVDVLCEMEFNGIALDCQALDKLSHKMALRIETLETEIYDASGTTFNIASPKQLAVVLFETLQLPTGKKGKTGYSTNQEVLESLKWQHRVPLLVLEYRQLAKLKNTYVDKLPSMLDLKTNRIHASFNQAVAATGRLSSSDPNLQNIPIRSDLGKEIRRSFIAPDDHHILLAADYSQIELRLLAHFTQDPDLLEAFANDVDIHQFVASQVYNISLEDVDSEQRSCAKAVNFGIIYGQTAYGLSQSLGIGVHEAQQFIDDYFARYQTIKTFIDKVIKQTQQDGLVTTIMGRERLLPDINSKNSMKRKLAERVAVNTVIQGSAADMIKIAMNNIHKQIIADALPIKLLLQVHDELVFECEKGSEGATETMVSNLMCNALDVDVPIAVQVAWGATWLDCK